MTTIARIDADGQGRMASRILRGVPVPKPRIADAAVSRESVAARRRTSSLGTRLNRSTSSGVDSGSSGVHQLIPAATGK
ncbi:hypothetical protein ACWGH2_27995 [Streptomyces sp. NPDC054871]